MTKDEFILLFEKYLAGNATPQEVEQLMHYQDDFQLAEDDNDAPETYAAKRNKILNHINRNKKDGGFKINFRTYLGIAAAVVLFLTVSILFTKIKRNAPVNAVTKVKVRPEAKPGTNKALLTLADGKQVVLNDVSVGVAVRHRGIIIQKHQNGEMQFRVVANASYALSNELNTLSTPIGAQYQILLPDGSKVWLNAASSLTFPTAFAGKERVVELKGEGYFEVAKNRKEPFKVKYQDQQIEVLGTHFNISAYTEDKITKATLLEGAIRISQNSIRKILTPGQQAVYKPGTAGLNIHEVDVEQAVAWKNGLFTFKDQSIKTIMNQIARWYDIDVAYEGNLKDLEFGGRISKSKSLSEILKNLELTGTVHFKVDGRRVTVME